MSTSKRAYKDVDPDYTDACEQQTKRQKVLEQDAKQSVGRRIQSIVRNEFRKEINIKELELHQVDRRLNEARLMMDRLRACIISTYYGQINQSGTSEVSKTSGPPSSIHPAVKKHLGKRPSHHELHSDFKMCHTQPSSRAELTFDECAESLHKRSDTKQQQKKTSIRTPVQQSSASAADLDTPAYLTHEFPPSDAHCDDRWARFKIKKKIIIGNVSKYIPVDHREANDKSSHKWMVYVRGPKLEPDISGYVKKVWFFLHHSYKPNDLVEISCPPFHLTRRGWGEFPVRVQLHFFDPRNKKVDIIHQLKLDKTFSGLQSLGAETTVELDLERDFPGADNCNSQLRPSTGASSTYNQSQLCSSSEVHAPIIASSCNFICSQSDTTLPEQSQVELLYGIEADKTNSGLVTEVLGASLGHQSERNQYDNCLVEICDMSQPLCEVVELEAISLGNSVQDLEEYNVTIVHDNEKCADTKLKEQNMVTEMTGMVSDMQTAGGKNSRSSLGDLHTKVSASFQKRQPTCSSSVKTALTVFHKTQGIIPDCSHSSNRASTFPFQISQQSELDRHCDTSKNTAVGAASKGNSQSEVVSVASVQQSLTLSCSGHISKIDLNAQSSNSILMTKNELCANPLSSSTSAKQVYLSMSSSSSLPILTLPILSTNQVVRTPASCSEESSVHVLQNLACTTSDSTQSAEKTFVSSLTEAVLQVKENRSTCTSDVQKVIIIQSNASSNVPELVSANATVCEDKSLLQSKPSGPRQVSLLTGRIFSQQAPPSSITAMSSASHSSNESQLASNIAVIKQAPDQTATLGNHTTQRTKYVSEAGGQLLLIKNLNHSSPFSAPHVTSHLLCQSSTLTNQMANMNGSMKPGLSSQLEYVSMTNSEGPTVSPTLPVSFLKNFGAGSTSITQASHNRQMQIRTADIPGHDQSHIVNGQSCSAYPKMSAIGITKFGKNSAAALTPNICSRSTTEEERKRNQYEVLIAWKKKRLLLEKGQQVVRTPRDRIEGYADIIPELNLDDYTSMRALLKAAVQLHPLVQVGVNKLTHPYCAESVEDWLTWTLGKQLASEWHRSCFVLKYLKPLLEKSVSFRGEQLMTTRQLVQWCRLHAFSPHSAVKAKPEDSNTDGNSQTLQDDCLNSSFTSVDTLEIDLLAESEFYEPEASSGFDNNVLDIVEDPAVEVMNSKMTPRVQKLDNDNLRHDCLALSDGALFVFDELRKRGLRLQPCELEPGVMSYTAADMLYTVMQEFLADILRETVAVNASLSSQRSAADITRKDVHQALIQLPEAAFSCNKFLGKAEMATDGSRR